MQGKGFTGDYKKLVLVVDDEFVNRQMLGYIISRDYDVIYAENGEEALEQIQKNRQLLSMILLDIVMPKMDGFQVLDVLTQDEELARIPVIVLTSDKSLEVKALNHGAVDFIPKPYDSQEVILARVRRNIQLYEDSHIIRNAERDRLTGLYTNEFFYEYARQWNVYNPYMTMDAVAVNISHFHLVNELYGHKIGDEVLRLVGQQIQKLVDRIGGLGCRTEADNFFLYVPHQSDPEALLTDLRAGVPAGPVNDGIRLRIGINSKVDQDVSLERHFSRAVQACHMLRGQFATTIAFYDDEMKERELYQDRLLQDMDAAIEKRQFQIFYQPKFDITGEEPVLVSAEALVRWDHPQLGFINPIAFIPLFEENGLIQRLDSYVWEEAGRQIARWKETYGISIPVSVNVSRVDISHPSLKENLLRIIRENRLNPDELLLEITESAYTGDSRQIIGVVERLRAEGFHIEMDDFGAGYSSLNMLVDLPIDALKLDMGFIRRMAAGDKNKRMVELIVDIARFLQVPVIAEGVETREQLDALKEMGCDMIQGYYFSEPIPAEKFVSFIEDKVSDK